MVQSTNTAMILLPRLSLSMSLAPSSRVKIADDASCTPPLEWVLIPHRRVATPNVRDRDNSLPVNSVTTVASEGPSPVTSFVLPRTGVTSESARGAGHAAASGAATIASSYGPSIAATITSTPIGGTSSGSSSTTIADATGAANSFTCSGVEGRITSVASRVTTFEGDPLATLIA